MVTGVARLDEITRRQKLGYIYLRDYGRISLNRKILQMEHAKHQHIQSFLTKDHEPRSSFEVIGENIGNVARHAFIGFRVAATPATLISGFMMSQIELYGDVDQWRFVQAQSQ